MARNGGCASRLKLAAYVCGSADYPGDTSDLDSQHGAIMAFAAANQLEIGLWCADIQAHDTSTLPALSALCEAVRRHNISKIFVADAHLNEESRACVVGKLVSTGAEVVRVDPPPHSRVHPGSLVETILAAHGQHRQAITVLQAITCRCGDIPAGTFPRNDQADGRLSTVSRQVPSGENRVYDWSAATRRADELRQRGESIPVIAAVLNAEGYGRALNLDFTPLQAWRMLRERDLRSHLHQENLPGRTAAI